LDAVVADRDVGEEALTKPFERPEIRQKRPFHNRQLLQGKSPPACPKQRLNEAEIEDRRADVRIASDEFEDRAVGKADQ
jgi:hypothetical protein